MATGTEVLSGGRRDHVVLFYRDETEFAERVGGYILPAIQDGGVGAVIDAAIEVEAMWNELAAQHSFSLLCAYPAKQAACAHQ